MPAPDDPLILTALFDAASQARFQALRDCYFPPALNIVPAHATLFHKLPQQERDAITATIAEHCARQAPVAFTSPGWRFLGSGTAMIVVADGLTIIRQQLAAAWMPHLSPQDRQPYKPHVTIQNKVRAAAARATYETLCATGLPDGGTVTGLRLWFYRGGPWQYCCDFPFSG